QGTPYSVLESVYNYDQNNDGIIDATEHNGCIAISGKLVLDQNLSIQGCPNIRMQPCSEIAVNAFAHLTMEYNNIYGCETMWRGITVASSGRLTFRNNSIADAQYALLATPTGPFTGLTPTQVDIQHNRFERDHVGLYIPGNGGGIFGGNVWHTPFIGNVFECRGKNNALGDLLPPCDAGLPNYDSKNGYAGVAILGANFDVGAATGIRNRFVNLRNGVIAENVFLDVRRSDFVNMIGFMDTQQPGFASSTGVGVAATGGIIEGTECTFDRAGHAVNHHDGLVSLKNSQTEKVRIGLEVRRPFSVDMADNNQIGFLRYGVRGWNLRKSGWLEKYTFDNNTFQTQDNQTEASNEYSNVMLLWNGGPKVVLNSTMSPKISRNIINLDDYVAGILINDIGGWNIADNDVTINLPQNPPQVGLGSYGISFEGSDDNYLYGNTVTSSVVQAAIGTLGYGASMSTGNKYCCNTAIGTDAGVSFTGSCQGTKLRQTDLYNHKHCLTLHGNQTVIGHQPVQISGAPPTTNSNRFYPSSGTAMHFGGPVIVPQSLFFVTDPNTPHRPEMVSTPNAPSAEWFKTNNALADNCLTDALCAPLEYPEGERSGIETSDLALVWHVFDTLTDATMLRWELARDLYARLKTYPEMHGQVALVDSFFSAAEAGGAIKSFYDAEVLTQSVDEAPEAILSAVQHLRDSLQAIEAESAAILAGLPSASNLADSLLLYWQAQAVRNRLVAQQNSLLQVRAALDSLRQVRAQATLPVVNALLEADVLQSNQKAVWRVYLEMCADDASQLDEAQFDEVSEIAHQCPFTGGRAVLAARGLYRTKIAKHFDDDALCVPSGARQGNPRQSAAPQQVLAWPNPAQDRINIAIPAGAGAVASIQLLDLTGRVILDEQRLLNGSALDMDISNLKSGLYLCRVSVAQHQFAPVKISIIR
ncbi:MAG: T9SS type A sorting domain-containing protein, partial [Saprospiraceae bacterium]